MRPTQTQRPVKIPENGGFKFAGSVTTGGARSVSNAFTAWGQYIIHDVVQTPDIVIFKDEDKVDANELDPNNPQDLPEAEHFEKCTCENAAKPENSHFCHHIVIENDDRINEECLFITRSEPNPVLPDPDDRTTAHREQLLVEMICL